MNLQIVFAVFTVALLTSAGGFWIALRKPSWYTDEKLSLIVAFGSGLLISICSFEFLPHAFEFHSNLIPYAFLSGILFIIFTETIIAPKINFLNLNHHHHHEESGQCSSHLHEHEHLHHSHLLSTHASCSAIGCLLVCSFFDGIQLHSAFLIGQQTGWFTSFGLLFHVLPDGVLVAGIALAGRLPKKMVLFLSALSGITLILGSASSMLLGHWLHLNTWLLPFASGVLLYVTLIHLLPIALKSKRGLWVLFLGALFFILVSGNHTH